MSCWNRKLSPSAARAAHKKTWLDARMRHDWQPTDAGSLCTRCSQKYTPTRDGKRCKARRKPNRWRMHEARAWVYNGRRHTPPSTPADWLALLRKASWSGEARIEVGQIDHPEARRYRRILRHVWTLPVCAVRDYIRGDGEAGGDYRSTYDRAEGTRTKRKKALLARAAKDGTLTVTDGPCTYTLKPEALQRMHA